MNDLRTFSNKHGSLAMERLDRIIVARFSGSVNANMLRFFAENLISLSGPIKEAPWAYLSASENAFAATAEAEVLLIKAGAEAHKNGCVQAAYVLKSPVAVAQTKKIRATIGVSQPLEDVLFSTEQEAKDYLISYLNSYSKSK